MKPITAVFVTYNSHDVIANALASLQRQPDIERIIVVDNNSSDETRALIRRDFPNVMLIENSSNEGYGNGCNAGLAKVTTPFAMLINPDAILKEGAIGSLYAAAERYTNAALLAPLLYDEGGTLHHSHKRSVFLREKNGDLFTPPEGDLCADFLSGAVWLLNMKLMQPIGFFDRNIFLYYEDDDLCLRVRKAGLGLVLVQNAQAIHLQGASSGAPKPEVEFAKQKHMLWSRLYIEEKYRGRAAAEKLARKLQLEYAFKASWYLLNMKRRKVNRYRGRIAGIFAFSEKTRPQRIA